MAEAKRIPLGPCRNHACETGTIIKKTEIEDVRTGKVLTTCYCNSCGILYNADVIENLNPTRTAPKK